MKNRFRWVSVVGLVLAVILAAGGCKTAAPKMYVEVLDLKPDPKTIAEYKKHHEAVWPEVITTLKKLGVTQDRIYLLGTRMAMLLEVPADFDLKRDFAHYMDDPKIREWEELMKTFQSPPPGAKPGEYWTIADKVFDLNDNARALGIKVEEPKGKTKMYVQMLDLKPDPDRIALYKNHHREIWPEVTRTLKKLGVTQDRIYLLGTRLVMLLEVPENFDLARDFAHYMDDPKIREWEELMKTFQSPPPGAKSGEYWTMTEKVFDLNEQAEALKKPKAAK